MEISAIEELLQPILKTHDLSLYSVKWIKQYGFNILQILVDKEAGIDLDTLAIVNEYISNKLDEFEDEMPDYMLEVSSPGAEKELRTKEEIEKSVDEYIHVKTKDMIYEGNLVSFIDDVLVIKINVKGRMKNISINYEDIKKIRLAVKI